MLDRLRELEAKLEAPPLSSYPSMTYVELLRMFGGGFIEGQKKQRAEWVEANPDLARERVEVLAEIEAITSKLRNDKAANEKLEHLRAVLQVAGFGRKEVFASENYRDTDATKAALGWLDGEECFLLLSGGPGTGKSVAGAVLARRFESDVTPDGKGKPRRVLCFRAVKGPSLSLFHPESQETVERMRSVRFLVIDDLGAEMLTDVWRQIIDDVVDARYRDDKRTCITTNFTPEAFRDRYGTRIADRIRHGVTVAVCNSASMRKADK